MDLFTPTSEIVYIGILELPYRRMLMSHMASPSLEALHRMADAIGVNRKWFQDHEFHPHYDICKAKKQKAIALGAVLVSDKELIRKCYPKMAQL